MGADMLRVDVQENGGTKTLVLGGELDAFTCDRLRAVGESCMVGARKMILDLDRLDYIDSAGLAVLVHMWVVTRRQGVELVLSCGNRRVNRIMEITGLDRLFGSYPLFDSVRPPTSPHLHPKPVRSANVEKGLSAG